MTLTVAAAPTGMRVGITAAGGPTGQLQVTVAPKVWRSEPARHRVVERWPDGRHTDLTLFELDRLQIEAADEDMLDLVRRMLTVSRHAGSDGSLEWDSSLLVPDFPAPGRRSTIDSALSSEQLDATTDLLELFDKLDLLAPKTDDLVGSASSSPLHRPLVYRRFIDEVTARVHAARRGYRAVTRTSGVVRGRIDRRSLITHVVAGQPQLTCHYDELTESTVLLGVICAGLEWIAEGRTLRSPYGGRFADAALRHDAVVLRRALSEIAALRPLEALAQGPRLRLNRLDQPWAQGLNLALTVLRTQEFRAQSWGTRQVEAVELSVQTNVLWERIVHMALAQSGFEPVLLPRAQRPGLASDPWVAAPPVVAQTRPDNVAWFNQNVYIVDAKYKLPETVAPDRDDQYQMFAYSHLVRDESSRVTAAVLVYPGPPGRQVWTRGRDRGSSPVRLFKTQMPFPSPGQVKTPSEWMAYLSSSGGHLAEQLEILGAAAVSRIA